MPKKYTAMVEIEFLTLRKTETTYTSTETTYTAFPADTFAEAANIVEDYFGDDLISMKIELLDFPFIMFNKEIKDKLMEIN